MAALTVLLVTIYAGSALGASNSTEAAEGGLPDSGDVLAAVESQGGETGLPALTDAEAAEGVPLQDLQRSEALDLLNGVFEVPVEAAAGVYDELQGATLLGAHVAVLPEIGDTAGDEEPEADSQEGRLMPGDQGPTRNEAAEGLPEAEARAVEGPPPDSPAEVADAVLADSTVPLDLGKGELLDLSLRRQNGRLEPAAPLVESQIPAESGEAIELPGVGIGIELEGLAEGRSASISGNSVAFYPNVAKDSDLAVSPTPTGVETMFQMRSFDSPDSATYELSLPTGAQLEGTEAGGAEVHSGGEVLLSVPAPSAIDASGATVPTKLEVEGHSLVVSVEPGAETQMPILVDPLFQTYEWAVKGDDTGICSSSYGTTPPGGCEQQEEWGYKVIEHYWGGLPHLKVTSGANGVQHGIHAHAEGQQEAGNYATAFYTVPRYFKETPAPTSYIKSLKLSDVDWEALGQYASPYLHMGIWDATASNWVSSFLHTGQAEHGIHEPAYVYEFSNPPPGVAEPDTHAKAAEIGIFDTESTPSSNASVYVGAATVELGDLEAPETPIQTSLGSLSWVNQGTATISFSATDTGLGVYALGASTEEVDSKGKPLHTWTVRNGCLGVGNSACPKTWNSTVAYEPNTLPSGIDYLSLVAEDPVGNKSASGYAEVKVDHIAPTLALTGTMTEQDSLGTRRASYTLKVTGSDGNAERPQSGIAKAEVKIDGKAVAMEGKQAEEWSPRCATQNCSLAAEWTLDTSTVAEGKHTVEVIATDAVGNVSAPTTLTIETRPASAPTLALSGTMTEQATLGTSRPRYLLKAKSSAMAAGFESPTLGATPTYSSSVGSGAAGNGELSNPVDAAADSSGNTWVADMSRGRLQKFNEKGEWMLAAASSGSGAGMLTRPMGVATDSKNNVWVADTGNNRIVEFNEKGEFVETFGSGVNKTKVEAGGTEAEKNLCTAASGNVCQAATAGSLAGQLKEPKGIALTSGGNVWVADTGNNRLEKFNPSGGLINNISGLGSEPGKLKEPAAVTVAPDGSIWVADTGNKRIEQWSSSLAFVRAVGKSGSGAGEFTFPSGIEADANGEIWVVDCKAARVQEFDEWGTYLGMFGSAGSGSGQLATQFPAPPGGMAIAVSAMGVTVDGKGSVWVTDAGNARLQRWVIPGFPVSGSSVGSAGSGNSQFMHLAGLASDGNKGHVWALDQELGRLQEFNEKGEWQRNAGSKGSGAGMLSSPAGVTSSGLGNVWVADTGNNRIVEFNEKGEFVETFGSGVNKTKVEAGGTEAEKNLCTAASGNVCQAATAGSAAGQLKAPQGIALTSGGNVWVADTGNNRIEKFNTSGGLLNSLSGEGTEPGKLKEPMAIAVAPDGSIWVADTGNNRIQAWNSSLALIHTIGKEGSGGGEFKSPAAIFADASGNIWVGDQKNNRVEEFGEGGRYRGQFGANGSGKFSFSAPMGLVVDNGGSIWVSDPGHSKIQRWTQVTPRSEITTTLWIDGQQQTGLHGTCMTAGCTIEPQWSAESLALSAGSHTARVKTTDGLGRSTEGTVSFQIARDTTKPTLEVTGELFNAPEGWVEQESYALNATATDSGYGVTSISFKIDGQQVASASQSCSEGACKETLSKQISMASYSGGSHPAEVIATDGAGNSFVKRWTINVDPEGHISTKEASSTLEAMESTTNVNPVGQSQQEAIYDGTAPGLGVEAIGSSFAASGNQVPLTVGSQPTEPMTLQILPAGAFSACEPDYFSAEEMAQLSSTNLEPEEAEPGPSPLCENPETPTTAGSGTQGITVTPTATATGAGSNTLLEGNAIVAPNTSTAVDTITRPLYEGALVFKAIRDEAGPTSFTWEIHLESGQRLKLTDPQHATVYFASGHAAFTIAAEPASDAVGTAVPTELEVTAGNLVTLLVKHREKSLVYPVLAGAGWQGGFSSVEIQGPKDEQELREERERLEREEQEHREAEEAGLATEGAISSVGLEELVTISVTGPPEASASSADGPPLTGGVQQYTFSHHFKFFTCDYSAGGPSVPDVPRRINEWAASRPTYCKEWITESTPLNAGMNVRGWWKSNQVSRYTWIPKGDLECNKFGRAQPALVHCLKRPDEPAAEGKEVHVFGDFRFPPGSNYFLGSPTSASPPACVTVRGGLANGPETHKEEPVISPAKVGEQCNWP